MPRIRTLKPEILEDEKTSRLSDTAFRLFSSMIVLADDHGNVRADARWLQAQIWWAHREPPNVVAALIELSLASLVDAYEVRGGTYATLRGWTKHQRVDNAGRGRVPSPGDPDAHKVVVDGDRLVPCGDSPRVAEVRGEMRLDQEGDPEGEKEGEGETRRSAACPSPSGFSPREAERKLAEKLGLDCAREAEQFRDYYAAKGRRLSDWNAGFRGWLRKAVKFNSGSIQDNESKQQSEPREIPEL